MSPLPALLALAALTGCAATAGQVPSGPGADPGPTGLGIRSEPLPPPAPEGAPEAEEAAAALADGSSTALILFLARHPDNAAAPRVRAALARRTAPDAAARIAAAGGEAEIVAAFDAARRAGTDAAWDAFAARFGSHPLVAESRAWR